MPYCTKCGARLEEYARFCPKCGHSLDYGGIADQKVIVAPTATGQRFPPDSQTARTEGSSQAGTIAIFFGAIALVAGLIFPFGGIAMGLIALMFGFTASNRHESNASTGLAIALVALIVSLLAGVFWFVFIGGFLF